MNHVLHTPPIWLRGFWQVSFPLYCDSVVISCGYTFRGKNASKT